MAFHRQGRFSRIAISVNEGEGMKTPASMDEFSFIFKQLSNLVQRGVKINLVWEISYGHLRPAARGVIVYEHFFYG